MEIYNDFLNKIDSPLQRERVEEVLRWIRESYPDLKPEVKWNQPMFTDHGTYIIGFSVAKQHLAVAPETKGIHAFAEEITLAGYTHTDNLFRIQWNQPVNYSLLKKIIDFNIQDKMAIRTFWR